MTPSCHIDVLQIVIIALGYVAVFATSGAVVGFFIKMTAPPATTSEAREAKPGKPSLLGAVIGKCENFLTVTFILADAITALALIFTAKSIVRGEDMRKNPQYYLVGTVVNFSYSVLLGFLVRIVLQFAGHPL